MKFQRSLLFFILLIITGWSTVCVDTDTEFAVIFDSDGESCARYYSNPQWCGYYDTKDFKSSQLCCACGGGYEKKTASDVSEEGGSWCEDNDPDRIQIKCSKATDEDSCNEVDEECEWVITKTHEEPVCAGYTGPFESLIISVIVLSYVFLICFLILDYCRRKWCAEKDEEYLTRQMNYLRGTPEIVKGAGFWENRNWYICNEYLPLKMIYGDFAHFLSKFEAALMFVYGLSYTMFITAMSQVAKERYGDKSLQEVKLFTITLPILIVEAIFFRVAQWDDKAGLQSECCCCKKMARCAGRSFCAFLLTLSIIFSSLAYEDILIVLNPNCFIFNVCMYGPFCSFAIGYVTKNLYFWAAYQILVEKVLKKEPTEDDSSMKRFALTILSWVFWITKPGEFKVSEKIHAKGVEDAGGDKSVTPAVSLSVN